VRGKVLCVLFLACVPTGVLADGPSFGRISLYSDPAFVECALSDSEPGYADVFLVHNIGPVVGNAYLIRFRPRQRYGEQDPRNRSARLLLPPGSVR
jgi:hypothetical protein